MPELLPLYQDKLPFLRNRLVFALLAIVLILPTSIQPLKSGLHLIWDPPSFATVLQNLEWLKMDSQNISDALVLDAKQEYNFIRYRELLLRNQTANDYYNQVHQVNRQVIDGHARHRDTMIGALRVIRSIVSDKTAQGSAIRYKETATMEEIAQFERAFGVVQGAMLVQDLAMQSNSLKSSIQAKIRYDLEYAANKTQFIQESLPRIRAQLDLSPEFEDAVLGALLPPVEQAKAVLVNLRKHFARIYSELRSHLMDTRASFDEIADAYTRLRELTAKIIDTINDFGLNLPALDSFNLDNFGPSFNYRITQLEFPTTDVYLKPLDDFIDSFDATFDGVGEAILSRLNVDLDTSVDGVFETIAAWISLEDYMPPPIVFNGSSFSELEALELDKGITANLTRSGLGHLRESIPGFNVDVPKPELPTTDFELNSLDFAQSIAQQLQVTFSWLKLPPQVWTVIDFVMLVWGLDWGGFGLNAAYRAFRQFFRYWAGTAVTTLVVEMRTRAEIESEKKRSKKTTATVHVARVCSSQSLYYLITYGLVFLASMSAVWLGFNYEMSEFRPKCIWTNEGTSIATETVYPLVVNRGLILGNAAGAKLNRDLVVAATTECRAVGQAAFTQYSDNVVEFEQIRAQTSLAMEQVVAFRSVVLDSSDICDSPLNRMSCRVMNTIRPLTTELEKIVIDCTDYEVPSIGGNVNPNAVPFDPSVISERVCIVQWWALGNFWILVGTLASLTVLVFVGRNGIVEGLHIIFRRFLRPEEFHINSTCRQEGTFTQPEYDDEKARHEAISQNLFWIRIKGWVFFLSGCVAFIAFASVGAYLALNLRSRPVWWNP